MRHLFWFLYALIPIMTKFQQNTSTIFANQKQLWCVMKHTWDVKCKIYDLRWFISADILNRHTATPIFTFWYFFRLFLILQMLEASLYISEHLPDGAKGLWALVHCASWIALGELEWIPFAVLRKSIDINLLGL